MFLERTLAPLREAVPALSITLEHVTTADGIGFVRDTAGVYGSITVHHLMLDRNDLLARHMRPHYYCLPILKRRRHREALREAATSGDPAFFLGTDSAPHPVQAKEAECCAAGVFSAPVALACLAHAFEEDGALDKLEDFTSINGAARYGVGPNDGTITLTRGEPYRVEAGPAAEIGGVRVFDPGHELRWRVTAP